MINAWNIIRNCNFKNNYETNLQTNIGPRNKYLLKEIVQDQTYSDLKNKLIKEKIVEDRFKRVDESNFRSTYGELNKIEKLDKMLENPNMTEEMVDQSMKFIEMFSNPAISGAFMIAMSAIFGLIYSLIGGLIMKREE